MKYAARFLLTVCTIFGSVATSSFAQTISDVGIEGQSHREATIVDLAENQAWDRMLALATGEADLNQTQPDGMTALHWAVFHRHQSAVAKLIEAGAEVNAATVYQVTPLSIACEFGSVAVARVLLENQAKTETKRLGGERPLMLASRNGNSDLVRQLIKHGAKVDARESRGQTALMWAAAAGHAEVVDELIKAGANMQLATKQGFNALMFAARQGKTEVAINLLGHGFDVNTVMDPVRTGGRNPRKGMSALLLAIESGHFELALELVRRGADPNDQRSGYAPLHAITWVRKTKVGDDPDGDPPPRITGKTSSLEFARQLVAAGADVNLQLDEGKSTGKAKLNPKGATPFLFASRTADIPLMKLLLKLGADPTLTNADNCNALMAAAGVGVVAVGEEPGTEEEVDRAVQMLAQLGLNVNTVDKNGETAMHGAAYRNYPATVSTLAQLGADPTVWNRKNKHGWTPHAIASGKRPGSVKPSPETANALDEALSKNR